MNCGLNEEFHPIILAGGYGTRLGALVEDIPKSLLRVANKPLLNYQLDMLEQIGFQRVSILVRQMQKEKIKNHVTENYNGKLITEVISSDNRLGTVQCLVKLRDKIKTQFLIIGGDLIADPTIIGAMLDLHLINCATATFGFKELESKRLIGDFTGLYEKENRLLFIKPSEQCSDNILKFNSELFEYYPKFRLCKNMLDSNCYILNYRGLEILEKKKQMHSFKKEFLPYLLESQYDCLMKDDVACHVYLMSKLTYCARVNSIPAYYEINKQIIYKQSPYDPHETPRGDSFVSESVTSSNRSKFVKSCISDSTSLGICKVNSSVIGKHCQIGNNVIISDSVIGDYVVVSDNCTLRHTLIGNNVHVESDAKLIDTVIGAKYNVEKGSVYEHITLSRPSGERE